MKIFAAKRTYLGKEETQAILLLITASWLTLVGKRLIPWLFLHLTFCESLSSYLQHHTFSYKVSTRLNSSSARWDKVRQYWLVLIVCLKNRGIFYPSEIYFYTAENQTEWSLDIEKKFYFRVFKFYQRWGGIISWYQWGIASTRLSQDFPHLLAGSFIISGDHSFDSHARVTSISLWSPHALKILLSRVNGNSLLQIKTIWPEGIG